MSRAMPMAQLVLPDALLDPAAYEPRPARVELRETHISWVFLAGDRAYKVKKPVVFPFLDYGSLERRHAMCVQELRLNRRLAPEIYLAVRAVVPDAAGRAALRDEHAPGAAEFAVEMRRYDDGLTLAARMAESRAGSPEASAVAAVLARFHSTAVPDPAAADSLRRLSGVVQETLGTLHELAPAGERERLQHLDGCAAAALRRFGPELDGRAAAGLVRDGHGDLRAEHVLLTSPPAVVDCVEFDRELRCIDVGYDLAFLLMDVARRDPDLARALERAYCASGGDLPSPRPLAFLVAVRALVRAKVDSIRAGQLTGVPADERQARARELLDLAERFAWRSRLDPVLCVAGLSGSGKSTVAGALGAASGRPVLSSDVARKRLLGIDPAVRAGEGAYSRAMNRRVYEQLGRDAARAVEEAGGAIVDATFRHAEDVDAFRGASATAGAARWVLCHAPPAVLLGRAGRRALAAGSASDADAKVVAEQLAETGGTPALGISPVAELDTARPLQQVLDALGAALDRVP